MAVVGAVGLGASLQLIHIYVAVLKKALQVREGPGCFKKYNKSLMKIQYSKSNETIKNKITYIR